MRKFINGLFITTIVLSIYTMIPYIKYWNHYGGDRADTTFLFLFLFIGISVFGIVCYNYLEKLRFEKALFMFLYLLNFGYFLFAFFVPTFFTETPPWGFIPLVEINYVFFQRDLYYYIVDEINYFVQTPVVLTTLGLVFLISMIIYRSVQDDN